MCPCYVLIGITNYLAFCLSIEFHTDFVRIFVPQATNDVYREGNYVYVKRLNSQFCPVALLERYILQAVIDLNSSLPLLDQ